MILKFFSLLLVRKEQKASKSVLGNLHIKGFVWFPPFLGLWLMRLWNVCVPVLGVGAQIIGSITKIGQLTKLTEWWFGFFFFLLKGFPWGKSSSLSYLSRVGWVDDQKGWGGEYMNCKLSFFKFWVYFGDYSRPQGSQNPTSTAAAPSSIAW